MAGVFQKVASFAMARFAKLVVAAILSAIVSANLLAFMQARAMTRFIETGERTGRPEQLSILDRVGVVLSGVRISRPQRSATPAHYSLPFETIYLTNRSGDRLEGWYVPGKDDGPIVLMYHGYAVSKSTLLTAARAVNQLRYATLLVDFYGSGGSSGSGTTIGVKESEDVAASVEFAKSRWPQRRIVLYGISMGGAALLRAMAVGGVKADGVIIEAVFDSLLNTAKNRFRSMGLPPSPFTELLLFWGSVQQEFNYFSHNPAQYAGKVECPLLILHGEQDQRATLAEARRIAAALGQRGRMVGFPGVPHMAIVDARRGEWMEAVGEFLQQLQ